MSRSILQFIIHTSYYFGKVTFFNLKARVITYNVLNILLLLVIETNILAANGYINEIQLGEWTTVSKLDLLIYTHIFYPLELNVRLIRASLRDKNFQVKVVSTKRTQEFRF